MPRPMVFFSYARDDLKDRSRLFTDLIGKIKSKVPDAEVGFVDSASIDSGDIWTEHLPEALQHRHPPERGLRRRR